MGETAPRDQADTRGVDTTSSAEAGTDWTGVGQDRSPIRPLDDATFELRLRLLSERAESLTRLRRAFTDQPSHGQQLPRDPEPASRPRR